MVNSHFEKIFFHNILRHDEYIEVTNPKFFDEPAIRQLFSPIKDFWTRYRESPTFAQVIELVKANNLETEITSSQLKTLWECDLSQYDNEWLREHTETFIEFKNLESSVTDIVNYLRTTPVTAENIKNLVDTTKRMMVDKNSIDFKFDEGSDFFNAERHRQPTYNTFSSGYEYIDLVGDGGFSAKTLTILVGQAKVGKSIWLANLAAQSVLQGNNTAVITLEMSEAMYIKRLGANLLNIPVNEYKKIAEDTAHIKRLLSNIGYTDLKMPGRLFVREFPTSSASVFDIESYLRKIEEKHKIKFKTVIIDYVNIMKNWRNPNSENTYMKIKQIAEDVRAMAQRNEWAIVSATQTKQSDFDKNDLHMGSASESSGLVATVDMMFGIIQDPIMYANKEYKLKTLANRNEGYKNSKQLFNIDYRYMRITQASTPIEEGTLE